LVQPRAARTRGPCRGGAAPPRSATTSGWSPVTLRRAKANGRIPPMDVPEPSSGGAAAPPGQRGGDADGGPRVAPRETTRRPVATGLSSPERLRQELAQAQRMEAIGQLVPGIVHEL